MDMSSNYYIVSLIAVVAAVAASSQQQLGIAFIAFGVAVTAFWLEKRRRKDSGLRSPAPGMLSQVQNSETAARRNRVLIRIWLPLAVVWGLGAWLLGVRDNWLLMGPPMLMFVVLAWWAHDPKRPLMAIAAGFVFAALGYLLFVR